MLAAAPDLIWAGIQAVRPVLIPAVYLLYRELFRAELARRQQEGGPPVPGPCAGATHAHTASPEAGPVGLKGRSLLGAAQIEIVDVERFDELPEWGEF